MPIVVLEPLLFLPKLTTVFISLICAIKTASSENFSTHFCISCPLLFYISCTTPLPPHALLSSCSPVVYLPLCIYFKYLAPHFTNNFSMHICQRQQQQRQLEKTAEKLSKEKKNAEKTNKVFFSSDFYGAREINYPEGRQDVRKETTQLPRLIACPSKLCKVRSAGCGAQKEKRKAESRKCCR